MSVRNKEMQDIFSDANWWLVFQQDIINQVRPIYMASFFVGVSFGLSMVENGNPDILQMNEAEWIRIAGIYANANSENLGRYLTNDTIAAVRKALVEAYVEGGGAGLVASKLAPKFGQARAARIASAETNKLFGLGAQEAYRAQGLRQWEWHTVNDGHVCPVCEPRNGQRYPISINFAPGHPVNCFIDPQVPVFTAKGWKPIGKIEIGDLVLTHLGRFRRVLAFSKRSNQIANVVKIKMKSAWQANELTLTDNHPVLTQRGWVIAGELAIGDMVSSLGALCDSCGFPVFWSRKVCKNCHYQHTARGLWDNVDSRNKAKEAIRKDLLYILLPENKIIIECDGEHWHKDVSRDILRDDLFSRLGYRVIRFTGKEIKNNISYVSETIDRLLANDNHEYAFVDSEICSIEKWTLRKPRTLYNFQVEEDESYIAKGFVVHNCRCFPAPVPLDDE